MHMETQHGKIEYYFNTETGLVEEGKRSTWEHLIGPFATFDAAARALETAAERSDAFDEEDKAWRREE